MQYIPQIEYVMNMIDNLYAAAQKSYEHLYDAITELAKHPDDDNCAMWEASFSLART